MAKQKTTIMLDKAILSVENLAEQVDQTVKFLSPARKSDQQYHRKRLPP